MTFKEVLYERNQPLIDAVYTKWEYVSECIESGETPTNEYDHLPLLGPVTA